MKLAMLLTACVLGWVGCQAPRILPLRCLITLPGRYCHYQQVTGEERLSSWFGVTSWWVVAPGFSRRPVCPQWPVLCTPRSTYRPGSPWLYTQVGTTWPSSLWPYNAHEGHLGTGKPSTSKWRIQADSPRDLPIGSCAPKHRAPSPSSPHADPLVPLPWAPHEHRSLRARPSPAMGLWVCPSSPAHPLAVRLGPGSVFTAI